MLVHIQLDSSHVRRFLSILAPLEIPPQIPPRKKSPFYKDAMNVIELGWKWNLISTRLELCCRDPD
jgi:hypothetical protein